METHIRCSMVYTAHDLIIKLETRNWKTEREKSSGVPPLTLSVYVASSKTHSTCRGLVTLERPSSGTIITWRWFNWLSQEKHLLFFSDTVLFYNLSTSGHIWLQSSSVKGKIKTRDVNMSPSLWRTLILAKDVIGLTYEEKALWTVASKLFLPKDPLIGY